MNNNVKKMATFTTALLISCSTGLPAIFKQGIEKIGHFQVGKPSKQR